MVFKTTLSTLLGLMSMIQDVRNAEEFFFDFLDLNFWLSSLALDFRLHFNSDLVRFQIYVVHRCLVCHHQCLYRNLVAVLQRA